MEDMESRRRELSESVSSSHAHDGDSSGGLSPADGTASAHGDGSVAKAPGEDEISWFSLGQGELDRIAGRERPIVRTALGCRKEPLLNSMYDKAEGMVTIPDVDFPVIGLSSPSGNYYPIEKDHCKLNGTEARVYILPYLTYENVREFGEGWSAYVACSYLDGSLGKGEVVEVLDAEVEFTPDDVGRVFQWNGAESAEYVPGQFYKVGEDGIVSDFTSLSSYAKECKEILGKTEEVMKSVTAVNTFFVGHARNYGITVSGNVIRVCWTDPGNLVSSDGATLASWGKTRLIMKSGGFPENENDGTVLVDSTVRDQYRETPFEKDLGSASDCRFALFTCTTGGAWNVSSTAPRFTVELFSLQTIAMMTRDGMLLQYSGMEIGSVMDFQVTDRFPKLRYKLAHVNYRGGWQGISEYHGDSGKKFNSIWIPNLLPCIGDDSSAFQLPYDAPELAYAMTWDEKFLSGKKYYWVVDGVYAEMQAGKDYQDGENLMSWIQSHDRPVYCRNNPGRSSYGSNDWETSNMRRWFGASGRNWFKWQNEFDAKSHDDGYGTGWLDGFDPDFLDIIKPVRNRTARNVVSSLEGGGGGGYEVTLDKFWLPSIKEVFGTDNRGFAEGEQFQCFVGSLTDPRKSVQHDERGLPRYVWLRSPNDDSVCEAYGIDVSGSSNHIYAYMPSAFLPVVCIA